MGDLRAGASPQPSGLYDAGMAKNTSGKKVKSAIGLAGFLATIASVWWFALRPRSKKD